MSNRLIDIVDITKSYGDSVILDQLNLYIRENEFLTLLGPSGCGKTTLLRILGGFETPDSGKIIFDGKNINDIPPNRRQLNTVFQKYALFSHMTIADNIAFGLKIKGIFFHIRFVFRSPRIPCHSTASTTKAPSTSVVFRKNKYFAFPIITSLFCIYSGKPAKRITRYP